MIEKYLDENKSRLLDEKISSRHDEYMKDLRSQLEAAKINCPSDKELFSIDVFKGLYDLTNDRGESIITPEVVEDLEVQYYLKNKDFKTMKEFAEYRDFLDGHNVG